MPSTTTSRWICADGVAGPCLTSTLTGMYDLGAVGIGMRLGRPVAAAGEGTVMVFDEQHRNWRSGRDAYRDVAAELAADIARIAATLAETATMLAAQREAAAQLVPQYADELLAKAHDAQVFAEHERREAGRWARLADDTSQQNNSASSPGGGSQGGPSNGKPPRV